MSVSTVSNKEFIQEYFTHFRTGPKTEADIDRYVLDPNLKKHILETEAGFPGYTIEAHDIVSEGDLVAVRATVHGKHLGPYMGIPPTGKQVSQSVMIFYQISNGRIQKFWMEMNPYALMDQLKG